MLRVYKPLYDRVGGIRLVLAVRMKRVCNRQIEYSSYMCDVEFTTAIRIYAGFIFNYSFLSVT